MSEKAENLFQQIGIEGGSEAVTLAAVKFINAHPFFKHPLTTTDLSEHELHVLEEGGFPTQENKKALSDNISTVAAEVGVMIASALTQAQAAQLLGVDPSRIRQRISHRTLYAITGKNNVKVLPRFQFTEEGVLPGLEKILPLISEEVHPIAVQRLFLTASADLYSEELDTPLSPRDWLLSGHRPEPVMQLAADL